MWEWEFKIQKFVSRVQWLGQFRVVSRADGACDGRLCEKDWRTSYIYPIIESIKLQKLPEGRGARRYSPGDSKKPPRIRLKFKQRSELPADSITTSPAKKPEGGRGRGRGTRKKPRKNNISLATRPSCPPRCVRLIFSWCRKQADLQGESQPEKGN